MLRLTWFRGRPRAATAALAAVALGVAPLTVPQPAAAGAVASAVTATKISWQACRDGFQCATVKVPLDYDRPNGSTISLSVIRLPAAAPGQRIGSLLVNPGGPGGSGVDMVRGVAQFLPLELRGRFDIVGFDPRGIVRSSPLRCFATFDEALGVLPPFAFPMTRQEENVQRTADRALATACDRRGGRILAHMSTADVARDMDLLRRALGDSKLTYLGFSYGSMIGQTYANLFPSRVRALVIDGVLDPVAWTSGRGNEHRTVPVTTRLRSGDGARQTLGEFFRLCDAAGRYCDFAGRSRQRYATLAARLKAKPIIIEEGGETFTFTYADLVGSTLGAMYAPVSWPDLASFLRDVEALATPARLGRSLAGLRSRLGVGAAVQEPYENFIEGFPGVLCSDSRNPNAFDAWRRAAAAEDRKGYFGRLWTWASSVCLPWPDRAGDDRHLGPWTRRTSSPVLVVGNRFDPATPYHGAVIADRLLPSSRLLTYAGWGHTAYLGAGNYCVDDHVTRYLVTTRVPPAGTVCRPQGSPFGPLEASALGRATAATVGTAMLPAQVRRALTGADR